VRYLVKAKVRPGREQALLEAIENGSLGRGSVAGDEYRSNMEHARSDARGVHWVEVCFCASPLAEERPYWEEYFELVQVRDAHTRRRCRDLTGEEPWACCDCDCTAALEERMEGWGERFLERLRGDRRCD
jgi:hypothetical protein